MNSGQLTAEQAGKLHAALFPHVNYLLRLQQRLELRGFPADDPLVIAATSAYKAAWELSRLSHKLACKVGAKRKQP